MMGGESATCGKGREGATHGHGEELVEKQGKGVQGE